MYLFLAIYIVSSFSNYCGANTMLISHRTNTVAGIEKALNYKAEYIEIDVQLSKDNRLFLLHPTKANSETDVANAPSLLDILKKYPNIKFILDMKSLPAETLVRELIKQVKKSDWKRLIVYSTNDEHLDWFRKLKPQISYFESRKTTRQRLVNFVANHHCTVKDSDTKWIGFEYQRQLNVTEKFALGEDTDTAEFVLWSKEALQCTKTQAPSAKIVFFGINTKELFNTAKDLGADAVYVDNDKLDKI